MKKLLSFFAAGAVLLGSLGLFSCSGDLHDNDTQPLYIIGGNVGCADEDWKWETSPKQLTLVEADGSVQKYTFKATASQANFKLATAKSWSNDIAGDDINGVFPVINGDFVELHSREAEGLPNTQNITVNDLAVGEDYTINVKFNATTLSASLQITGSAVVMPTLNIVDTERYFYYNEKKVGLTGTEKVDSTSVQVLYTDDETYKVASTAKVTDLVKAFYEMERAGTEYTYTFIAQEDKRLNFILESSTAGLTYGGATVSTSEEALTAYDDTAMAATLEKDHEYKITVKVPKLTTATIKAEEVKLLAKATVNANWLYSDAYFEKEPSDGKIRFVAKSTELKFTVNRKKDSSDLAWGGVNITLGDETALTYSSDGKVKDATVKGLTEGSTYLLTLSENTSDFTLKAKVEKLNTPVLSGHALYLVETTGDNTEAFVWGNVLIEPTFKVDSDPKPLADDCTTLTKVSDTEYTYAIDLTGKTLSKGYCALAIVTTSWWGERYEIELTPNFRTV